MTRRRLSPAERVAIFNRAYGFCHICKEHIGIAERWDVEHVVALALGGTEAKMDTNLQPAHALCHRPKTADDVGRIAKAKRVEARHLGATKPRSSLSHPTLNGQFQSTGRRARVRVGAMKELRPAPKPVRIKSKALTDSAEGRACTARWSYACDAPDTVVFCHVRIKSGVATKPPDFFGYYGCKSCHDRQEIGCAPYSEILRAVLETQSTMAAEGLLTVKGWCPR